MDRRKRSRRGPAFHAPGHAHELTFSCYRSYPFLQAERTCQWLAEAIEAARRRQHSLAAAKAESGRGLDRGVRRLQRLPLTLPLHHPAALVFSGQSAIIQATFGDGLAREVTP